MNAQDLVDLVDEIVTEPRDLVYVRRRQATIDQVGIRAWRLAYAERNRQVRARLLAKIS